MRSLLSRSVAIMALLTLVGAWSAAGQTTASGSSSLTIGNVLYISVSNLTVTFPTVTESHYTTGYVVASALSEITTKGNVTHSVNVKSTASTMTATGTGARANKPASDLRVRTRPSGGSYGSVISLSTSDQTLISGRAAGDYSSSLYEVEYRIMLDWATDTPGTYSLGFTYTVVAG